MRTQSKKEGHELLMRLTDVRLEGWAAPQLLPPERLRAPPWVGKLLSGRRGERTQDAIEDGEACGSCWSSHG